MSIHKLLFASLLITGLLVLAGCEKEGPMERAGENLDEMADDVEDEMETVGNQIEDACEDIREELNNENTNC